MRIAFYDYVEEPWQRLGGKHRHLPDKPITALDPCRGRIGTHELQTLGQRCGKDDVVRVGVASHVAHRDDQASLLPRRDYGPRVGAGCEYDNRKVRLVTEGDCVFGGRNQDEKNDKSTLERR